MSRTIIAGALLCLAILVQDAAQGHDHGEPAPAVERVLVAGASGRTGRLIVAELLAQGYPVRVLVRDVAAARALFGDAPIEYRAGDVRERASIDAALDGVRYLVSAVGSGGGQDPRNLPEFVDYGGVSNLAAAAAAAELSQVVLVSSAGITQQDHYLNRAFHNVLIWKGRGEEALRASGVPYTIVRPGGLLDEPGGERGLRLVQGDSETGLVPRADVARVVVAALRHPQARHRTFELFGADGDGGDSWEELFGALQPD